MLKKVHELKCVKVPQQKSNQSFEIEISVQHFPSSVYRKLNQGQARGYGRITHFLPLPTWGHDFPWAIVTQPVGIFQLLGSVVWSQLNVKVEYTF